MTSSVELAEERALRRFTSSVCRRAFSSPEAAAYEWTVSSALVGIVAPIVDATSVSGTVLDVGCGGGRLASHLAGRPMTTVVGLDPSAAQVRRVRQRRRQTPSLLAVRGS